MTDKTKPILNSDHTEHLMQVVSAALDRWTHTQLNIASTFARQALAASVVEQLIDQCNADRSSTKNNQLADQQFLHDS